MNSSQSSSEERPMRRITDTPQPADLAAIAGGLKALATSVDKLNSELPSLAAKETRRKFRWPAVFFAVLMLITLLGVWEGHQGRARLIDCTEPQGQCYQEAQARGQQGTGKIIQQLLDNFEKSLDNAVKQNNCDQGFGCAPGFTPNSTQTTLTTVPPGG